MDDKQFKQIIFILKSLDEKLSVLISQQKHKGKDITVPKSEELVYKQCTGVNGIEDIMKITKQNRNIVELGIKRLRKKGMIMSKKIGKRTVYQRV